MEFKPLNIYAIDVKNNDSLLKKIFPTLIEEKKNLIEREFKHKEFHWKAKIYKSNKFLKEIYDFLEKNKTDRNNIILYFNSELDNNIQKFIKLCPKIYRPFLIFVSSINHSNLHLIDNRLLTFILQNGEEDTINSKILSVLWEKDCYFNERGNSSCSFTPANLLFKTFNGSNASINFLLTGQSRAGKSTFINLLAKKYISLESCDNESVTAKINEFIIRSNFHEFNGEIKFYDTPGLIIKEKKNQNESFVISQMERIFQNSEDSKDDIHFIYFFIKPKGNLENSINLLKYLLKIKSKYDIPIIFIINGDLNTTDAGLHDISIGALKKFLKKNNLEKLFDGKIEDYNENDDEFELLLNSNETKLKDENIIKINLKSITDNNNNTIPISGIDDILNKTLQYLKEKNPLNQKDFEELLKNKNDYEKYEQIIKSHGDNEELKKIKEKMEENREQAKKLRKKIAEENSLFKKFVDLNAISENARYYSQKVLFGCKLSSLGTGFIPFPMIDISSTLIIQTGMIISISLLYGYSAGEIPINNLLQFLFGSGVNIAGDAAEIGTKNAIQFLGKETVEKIAKVTIDISKKTTQMVVNEITTTLFQYSSQGAAKWLASASKFVPVAGSILGGLISGGINYFTTKIMGERCIKYYESLLKKSGGANFYIARRKSYVNLFNFIQDLENHFKNNINENFEIERI